MPSFYPRSSCRRFDELDQHILKLPNDHPIFRLSPTELDRIFSGMNSNGRRPIRVPSLFPVLASGPRLDRYNSWFIGFFVLEQCLKTMDIRDTPMLPPIANRGIRAEYLELLTQNPTTLRIWISPSTSSCLLHCQQSPLLGGRCIPHKMQTRGRIRYRSTSSFSRTIGCCVHLVGRSIGCVAQ
jgi:hypothetical protein